MRSGLGEIIKYAIVFDPPFFKYLKKNWKHILNKKEPYLSNAIRTSVKWKVKTIEKDPNDQNGTRKCLNFGHTIGHAIESTLGFGKISHGEAVMHGMRVANALSMITKRLQGAEYNKIEDLLKTVSDSKSVIHFDEKKICQHLKFDKKKSKGKNEFVLLKGVGNTVVSTSIESHHIREAIRSSLF